MLQPIFLSKMTVAILDEIDYIVDASEVSSDIEQHAAQQATLKDARHLLVILSWVPAEGDSDSSKSGLVVPHVSVVRHNRRPSV